MGRRSAHRDSRCLGGRGEGGPSTRAAEPLGGPLKTARTRGGPALRIDLVCVGKPRSRALASLHDEYAGRISRLHVEYTPRFSPEARVDRPGEGEPAKEKEARALLASVEGGFLIALDPRGSLLTTEELAARLPRWARPRAVFAVGGPNGLHASVLDRADWVWSLSPLTFPHELVRVLFAEQIYRALTILRHVPYHR